MARSGRVGGIQGIPIRLGSHWCDKGGWGGGLRLDEAPTGALEVSKPRIATPGRGQSGQLGGSDLGVVGWGWGLGLRQLSPEHTGVLKAIRIVGSGVSKARIRKPGSGGRGGWGSYLDRGSNGVRLLSAWALFSSRGRVAACRVPLALSRSCLGLGPYLPWGSNGVGPQHQ